MTPQTDGLVATVRYVAQCAVSPPPYVICAPVAPWNLSGTHIDGTFGIALV